MSSNTEPKPRFIIGLQNQKWHITGAIAELIDNSFGVGRGNGSTVVITHNPRRRMMDVLDNGHGMESLCKIFQLGNTAGRVPGDIGIYGMGGTLALIWAATRVDIWSLRDGKVTYDTVDWIDTIAKNVFPTVSEKWVKATVSNTPPELLELKHGTLIRLHLSKAHSPLYPKFVQRDLATLFAPGFRKGKKIIWRTSGVESDEVILSEPTFVYAKPPISNSGSVIGKHEEELKFSFEIGIVEDLPGSKNGINISFGSRVVVPNSKECFRSQVDAEERYSGNGITGWIDLNEGWQEYFTTTKDGIDDHDAQKALMHAIFLAIKPLLIESEDEKRKVLFEEMQTQLNFTLNGKSKRMVDAAAGDDVDSVEQGRGEGDGEGGTGKGYEGKGRASKEAGTDTKRADPAISTIILEERSNTEMEDALCRAEPFGEDDIIVKVNKDHPAVQTALDAKPANRLALYFLIVREMASVVTEHKKLKSKMFSRTELELIEGATDDNKPRITSRLILEKVRNGKVEEAA